MDKKLKIGIICYPTYGGSGVVATELGKGLANKGHQIHFITYEQPTRLDLLSENLFYHKVDFRQYPLFKFPPYELALASKIVNVVLNEKLDLLHVHYAIPHASAAYLAKQVLKEKNISIPFITTLHGTDITLVGKDESYEPVVSFSINQSDGVTSVSQSLKEETLAFFDINNDITVIPNFIDLKRFKKTAKDHFKKAISPHGEKLITHTSNFRKVKRVEDVVKVFELILKKGACAKLLLVGDGPERRHIEELCHEKSLFHHVRFLGKIEAIEEVLSISDLFIMPSEKESFGLAALEAMACEVPILTTNTGGLPELNIHGETGFMSNIGDIEEMAKNALFILEDKNLPKFKRAALLRAKDFDIHKVLPRYEEFYFEVLEGFSG